MRERSGNRVLRQEKFENHVYEQKMITCGKANCGKCPHGPYWYVTIALRNGKQIKRYLGKDTPAAVLAVDAKNERLDAMDAPEVTQ